MPNEMHTHNYSGVTTLSDGHTHQYIGITGAAPNVPGHVHTITGTTTMNDAHSHEYRFETSQSVQLAGGHSHNYDAPTSITNGHNHDMSGITSVYTEPASPVQKIQFNIPGDFRNGPRPNRPGPGGPGAPGPSRPGPGGPGAPGPNRPGPVGPGTPGPNRPGPGGPTRPAPGQRPGVAPSTPPPSFTPTEQSPSLRALDPGAVAPCQFRFSYIWPRRGRPFWAWIIFVGRRSFSGFKWEGRRWVYFAMDLRDIRNIQCY
ncbi:MAG TPA: YmaF family protein [Bacillota bacterium]|nr:YmaF family protein [Bacillota bacterium]HOK69419.1 YmaF family protein [Bacillota bacterium]